MIPAGWTELKSAFDKHSGTYAQAKPNATPAHFLLLFYAVESGLKSVYLRQNRLNKTDEIQDENLQKSHDLQAFVKELRLPHQIDHTRISSCFKLQRKGNEQPHLKEAHQAWRYAVVIEPVDEEKILTWLEGIENWLKSNINTR